MTSVTTVILSRDMDVLLQVCLMHLHRATEGLDIPDRRVVVVDNASLRPTPSAMPLCPDYRLLRFDTHHSFSAGCNIGARQWPSDYYLFLNNDVLLLGDILHRMFATFAAHPELGICGARMLFPDGTLQHAGVVMGAQPVGPYHLGRKKPPDHVGTARERFQAITGACMLVRADVFDELGGFDEGFSFGYEDVDLCLRAAQLGYDVRCMQDSRSLHFESMTPGRARLGRPTLGQFFERWAGRYTIDG